MIFSLRSLCSALAVALIAACASPTSKLTLTSTVSPLSTTSLMGVEWIATVVEGVPYLQSPRPKLRWTSAEALSGTGGCNAFAGRASLGQQNSLRIGALVPVGKLCMTEPGGQEDMFFKALEQTHQARLESGQLLMLAEDGRVILRMAMAVGSP